MALKELLDLKEAGISDSEIIRRLRDADKDNLDEVNFLRPDGTKIKLFLPQVGFDPELFREM
ncbi:hypothetical protein GF361_00475 [Candidatus Woesearchaeota archaeon]|nr:hypothetical protein [Candidatus Woesearchaeota archaeon]